MQRLFFGLLLLIAGCFLPAVAQQPSPTAACGDDRTQFDVSLGPHGQDVAPAAEGKAQLYLIELYDLHDKGRFNRPTIRQGLDGAWLGATQGFSYLRADIAPGAHHLCARWQSHFKRITSEVSLNNFTAQPGETYYFRVQITTQGGTGDSTGPSYLDLQPVSADEGRFLVTEAAESISKPK